MSRRPFREGRNVSVHGASLPREPRHTSEPAHNEADAAPNPLTLARTKRPLVSDMTTDVSSHSLEKGVGEGLDRFLTELMEWPDFRKLGNDRIEALAREVRLKFVGELRKNPHDLQSLDDTKTKLSSLLNEAAALIEADPALSAVIRNHPLFVSTRTSSVQWDPSLPKAAPEAWNTRPRQDKRTALEFLEQVYGEWLPTPLTLTYLRFIDAPLYSSLSTYLTRNREHLPRNFSKFFLGGRVAKDQSLNQEIKELGIKHPRDVYAKLPNDKRRADRIYNALLRRQKRLQSSKKHSLT